jgi:hypothetical protein
VRVNPVDHTSQSHSGEGDESKDHAAVAPPSLGPERDDVDPDVDDELEEKLDERLHERGGNLFHGGLR